MGRGRKMKVSEINPIVSAMCSGAAHELERASYELVEESYALGQVLICASGRTQGCISQRGSLSMRELSEDLGRHPQEGWQVRQLGAKIVLWLYGAHRDSPRFRSGRSPLQSAPRPCRISHQSLKAPQAALGASGPKERSRTGSSGQRRGRDARPHPCSVADVRGYRLIRRKSGTQV